MSGKDQKKPFPADEKGAVTADWAVLSAAVIGLGLMAVSAIVIPSLNLPGVPHVGFDGAAPSGAPDITMPGRRLPRNPDHPTLWANPFHAGSLPDGFPQIGGREFSISGDGNPRLLVAGADPRVIDGAANPQFDAANYAASGIAFGDGGFHRILIDTPPENTTYTVQLQVEGQVIEYSFTNKPY